jgi:hypothetical protein
MSKELNDCDIIEIHNQIQKYHIKLQSERNKTYKKIEELVLKLSKSRTPYGGDDNKLTEWKNKYLIDCDKEENSIKKKDINYKDWKQLIYKIEEFEKEIEQTDITIPYLLATVENLVKEYKEELSKPLIITFMGSKNAINNKKCNDLYTMYIEKASDIIGEELLYKIIKKGPKLNINSISSLCINTAITNTANDIESEYADDYTEDNKVQFDDIGRVNLNTRYKYERKIHFRDTLQQFQGTQNKQINEKVYKDLEDMIQKHSLIDEKYSDQRRFHKVTKEHIRLFLGELSYYTHYEDTQLIFTKLTGKPAPNISKYEKELYDDFDELVNAFCKIPEEVRKSRKNFLNNKYVLRQLLRRRNIKVPEADLDCLKTPSRKREHDEIYSLCCNILGWKFTSLS